MRLKFNQSVALLLACSGAVYTCAIMPAYAVTDTYTVSGSWQAPAGITSVTVEVWGGGGGGGGQNDTADGGGGGGGGAYSKKTNISVTPLADYTVTVGAAGAGGTGACGAVGGETWFIDAATVLAKGGQPGCNSTGTPPPGGTGGAAIDGVGDVKFSGGNGGAGRDNPNGIGGPGGSSAGTGANGTNGPATWSSEIAAAPPAGGGIGGNGGVQNSGGNAPVSGNGGGGGGAGEGLSMAGGPGLAGKVIITYSFPPSVTFNNDFPALSSGTITVNYKMIDPDADTCNLTNNGSVAGVEYSTDGSTWGTDATMGAGGDGSTGLASSASPGTAHKFAWNSAADLPGVEDSAVYLRMAPNDGINNGSWVVSSAFAIDNKAPVVSQGVHFEALPISGDASFQLDAAYTEGNPGGNAYAYNLNGTGYIWAAGDADTADPAPYNFSAALDGDDKFTAIKSTHTDDMGNLTVSEDLSGVYVKPLTPYAPSPSAPGQTTVNLVLSANPGETGAGIYYVIKATCAAGTYYVQSGGALGGAPVWNSGWGSPVAVTGLTEDTRYWFSAAAGNPQDATPSEGENSASPYGAAADITTLPPPPRILSFEGGLVLEGLLAQ